MAPSRPGISGDEAAGETTLVPTPGLDDEVATPPPLMPEPEDRAGIPSERLTAAEYDQLPEILNSLEVARILHTPRAQVSRLAAEGKLPGGRIGRTWRFSKSAIERMVAGGWSPDGQRGE